VGVVDAVTAFWMSTDIGDFPGLLKEPAPVLWPVGPF
jgi:hypothetical protein